MNSKSLPNSFSRGWRLLLIALLSGCGPAAISGGTAGLLTSDGQPLPDVQVTLHRPTGEPVGYAISGVDGAFEMIAADSSGALQLPPGNYIVTLESVGFPADLPRDYRSPESTPLRIEVTSGERLLVSVTGLIPARVVRGQN